MKRICYSLCIILFSFQFPPSVFGQKCSDYPCVIAKVKKAITNKHYRLAFEQLESAEGYPSKDATEIAELRKRLFNAIEKEKDEAQKQKRRANMKSEDLQKSIFEKQEVLNKLKIETEKTKTESERVKIEKTISDNRAILMRLISQVNKIASKPCKRISKECNLRKLNDIEQLWSNIEDTLRNFSEVQKEKAIFFLQFYEIPSNSNIKKNIQNILEITFNKGIKQSKNNDALFYYRERAIFFDKLGKYDESDKDWFQVYLDGCGFNLM